MNSLEEAKKKAAAMMAARKPGKPMPPMSKPVGMTKPGLGMARPIGMGKPMPMNKPAFNKKGY